MRRKYVLLFIFGLFLCVLLISCNDNGITGEEYQNAIEATSTTTESRSFDEEIIELYTLDREYVSMLEKDIVIYFLFDKSYSVDKYHEGINSSVDFINTMFSQLTELNDSFKEKDSYINVGVASFSKYLDEKLPITAIGECEIDYQKINEIKSDVNYDETNYENALEVVITELDQFDSDDEMTKVIVLFSDFQETSDGITQYILNSYSEVQYENEEGISYITFKSNNKKYILLFGAYSNDSDISADKNSNYFNIASQDAWTNQLLRVSQINNHNSFGWIMEDENRTISINDCMVNKLFSVRENNDGLIRLQNDFDELTNEGIINSQNTGGFVDYELSTKNTDGFYYIRSYQPEFVIELSYTPIVVFKEEDSGTELNLHVFSHDTKTESATYALCINPQVDGGVNPVLGDISSTGIEYTWDIPVFSSTCQKEISKTLFIRSTQNGQKDIWVHNIDIPLYYMPVGEIEVISRNESDDFLDMKNIMVNAFHSPNSNPNIYLVREKNNNETSSETLPPENCPIPNDTFGDFEYFQIENILLKEVKRESAPEIFAGYSVNGISDCHSSYTIETFDFVVDQNNCGFTKIALIWEDKNQSHNLNDIICDLQDNGFSNGKCEYIEKEGVMSLHE